MSGKYYVEEFLYRGRPSGDPRSADWHLVVGIDGIDPSGRPYPPMPIMSSSQAIAAGWPLPEVLAAINAETLDALVSARSERDLVIAERDRLTTECSQLTVERNQLIMERDAFAVDKEALIAERDGAKAVIEPLKEQIRALKGVPRFQAVDLLKQITDAEKEHITSFVANDDRLRPLWATFLGRVVGAPIPLDSQTFLAALHGLRQALGDARVAEMFAALNIDLAAGAYIDPAR